MLNHRGALTFRIISDEFAFMYECRSGFAGEQTGTRNLAHGSLDARVEIGSDRLRNIYEYPSAGTATGF